MLPTDSAAQRGASGAPELLLLHALPLDGAMWAGQMDLLPGSTYAPTLYTLGETVEEWATAALRQVKGDRLIVVGCSVGGSCAIEVAISAPDRVAALVLIGTKAEHRRDPDLHASAILTLQEKGMEEAWRRYWAPLFSTTADERAVARTKQIALAQPMEAITCGINAFHKRPNRVNFLAAFSRPVSIVTGDDDVAPGSRICTAQAAAAPFGSLHVISGCGHYVPMERPVELNTVLRAVIAAQGVR